MKNKLGKFITQIRGVSYTPADVRNADDINAIPILRANNITESGIVYDDLIYLDKKCVKQIQLLCVGDILICASSGSKNLVGKAARITENKVCSFGAFCKVIRSQTVDNDFLHYFFQSPYYRKNVSFASAGVNINNISGEDIDNLEVNFPSYSEQRASSKKIGKTFDLILKRKQQLKKLDLLVKAKFYEMFGEYDLHNRHDDWLAIGSLAEVVGGSTPKTEIAEYWNGEYLWITPAEIDENSFVIKKTQRQLSEAGVKSCSLRPMPAGTVLLSSRAPIGKVAIAGVEMFCNQGFKNLICSDKLNPVFVYYLLKFNTEYLNSLGRGATFKEISKSIVENIHIPVPNRNIQNEFARFVERTEKVKSKLKLSLEKLELLKQSLLQKYFG